MTRHTPRLQRELAKRAARYDARLVAEPTTGFAAVFERQGRYRTTIGADTGLNTSAAARLCADKYFTEQFLAQAGLAVPGSQLIAPGEPFSPNLPCVIKPNTGMGGDGVSLVGTPAAVSSACEEAFRQSAFALYQPVLQGSEYRVVVLDDEVLYGYQRVGGASGVRNLARGGQVIWHDTLSAELLASARRAVAVCGLRYGGVDMFCSDAGASRVVTLEVNPTPGFKGLESKPVLAEAVFDRLAAAFFDM